MGSVWKMLRPCSWHQSIICRTPAVSPMPRSVSVRMANTGSRMPARDLSGLSFISVPGRKLAYPGKDIKAGVKGNDESRMTSLRQVYGSAGERYLKPEPGRDARSGLDSGSGYGGLAAADFAQDFPADKNRKEYQYG